MAEFFSKSLTNNQKIFYILSFLLLLVIFSCAKENKYPSAPYRPKPDSRSYSNPYEVYPYNQPQPYQDSDYYYRLPTHYYNQGEYYNHGVPGSSSPSIFDRN